MADLALSALATDTVGRGAATEMLVWKAEPFQAPNFSPVSVISLPRIEARLDGAGRLPVVEQRLDLRSGRYSVVRNFG